MTEELPALQEAADELVRNPARQPTPLATIEARASSIRTGERRSRGLLSAAAVVALVLGVTSLVVYQRNRDVDLQSGQVAEDIQPMRFRVTWDGGDDETITRVGELVDARLQSLGAGGPDVQMVGAPDDRSIDVTITPGLSLPELRLLLETPGVLTETGLGITSGVPTCAVPGHLTFDVGWPHPVPSDQCWTAKIGTVDLSGHGPVDAPVDRHVSSVEVVPAGERASVVIGIDGATPTTATVLGPAGTAGTAMPRPPDPCLGMACSALFLDELLLSEPLGYPNRAPDTTRTSEGWTVDDLARGDAEILQAILAAGPPVDVPIHVELLDGTPQTTMPQHPSTYPPLPGTIPAVATTEEVLTTDPPSTVLQVPRSETELVGPGASLEFWVYGSDGDLEAWTRGVEARFSALGLVTTLTYEGSSLGWRKARLDSTNVADAHVLEQVLHVFERPGRPAFASVLRSQPAGSHYPPDCSFASWGGQCLWLGSSSDAGGRVIDAQVVEDGGLVGFEITLDRGGALDGIIVPCQERSADCPTGRVALTMDGSPVATADAADIDPRADRIRLFPERPLAVVARDEYSVMLRSGVLGSHVVISFAADPHLAPSEELTPGTTAPGPGATQDPCVPVPDDGSGTPTTLGPNC